MHVQKSWVLRKAGFVRTTVICPLICPWINNFILHFCVPFSDHSLCVLKQEDQITMLKIKKKSLNFCSADVRVSMFIRPAMNLDKSGWNLE